MTSSVAAAISSAAARIDADNSYPAESRFSWIVDQRRHAADAR